jgi:hypothetical protein
MTLYGVSFFASLLFGVIGAGAGMTHRTGQAMNWAMAIGLVTGAVTYCTVSWLSHRWCRSSQEITDGTRKRMIDWFSVLSVFASPAIAAMASLIVARIVKP